MTNPYHDLEDYRFWSRAMTQPAPGRIDPVTSRDAILPRHKVATMGSCFAQHLARYLAASGFNYYIAENPPATMDPVTAKRLNYGVFSARYGNVYTVLQAEQLFDRAFGLFKPVDDVWEWNGGYVDAFRPTIEPDAATSVDEVRQSAYEHLRYVREVFRECDWLIFTLGLTEAWQSERDGAIYPLAPGVRGGSYDRSRYRFVNFTAGEVSGQLARLIKKIGDVNPSAKVLLTVSPVPLAATYEDRHVWVSTTYSKAALRVAAEEVTRQFDHVLYFPSYEIITSPAAGGRYYADDLRQVTDLGVSHVMKLFRRHFLGGHEAMRTVSGLPVASAGEVSLDSDIMCDEEEIVRALKESQVR